jgi:methyl-accepting chemotaxis protein
MSFGQGIPMNSNLRFSHKILLAASLVVGTAFALFTLYNDYLQRVSIQSTIEGNLRDIGEVSANNIQSWMAGRVLSIETMLQAIELNPQESNCSGLMKPDTHLGENARQIEVSDDQTTPFLFC